MFINESACVGCAACIAACRKGAISVFGVAKIDHDKCTECGACVLCCPNDAILKTLARSSAPSTERGDAI